MTDTHSHEVHLYDASGTKKAILTDFNSLNYRRRVNAPGSVWFSIDGNHSILSEIDDKWIVRIRRRNDDFVWQDELWALLRDESWAFGKNGPVFTGYCEGIKSILGWRIVNWVANLTNRTKFVSTDAESIMKLLVQYNLTSDATVANGRKRNGEISSISIETNANGGNSIDWRCHGDNVLETLMAISGIGGGDFDLFVNNPNDYEFRFYNGQLGDDLTSSLTFSIDYGNMIKPLYTVTRSSEKTVAAVWGQGIADKRDYVTRTGNNYSSSNDIEVYVDGKSIEYGDTQALNSEGDDELEESEAKDSFTFEVNPNEQAKYREDFDLGDLAIAINPFNGNTDTYQIIGIDVKLKSSGLEEIGVDVEVF